MSAQHTQGSLQQGRLLSTKITERWTPEEKERAHAQEQRMLFTGFTPFDEGRSRQRVAICEHADDARRLAACWNASDGLSTQSLETMIGNFFKPPYELLREVEAQRDELLAALKIAVRQNSHDMLMTADELRICEAAIAKHKPTT